MNMLRQEFSSHFLTLKKLNRLDKLRTKQSRDKTQASRQQVDSYHLQLQNLLYEVLHLEKEVSKCLQFKSEDEEIDLVSLEEFYKNAPEEISRPVNILSSFLLLSGSVYTICQTGRLFVQIIRCCKNDSVTCQGEKSALWSRTRGARQML